MTEDHTPPALPDTRDIIDAVRTGIVKLLPPEDLAQIDLQALNTQTPMLSLPIDSVVLMALMNELEDTFTVYIGEEDAFSFDTIGDLAGYLHGRLNDKARRLRGS